MLKNELPILRQAIIKNHKEGRGQLCEDDLDNLNDWKFHANVSENKYLVKEGYKELKGIGERYQERFPKLLTRPFVNESYTVSSVQSTYYIEYLILFIILFRFGIPNLSGQRPVLWNLLKECLERKMLQIFGTKHQQLQILC